MVCNFRMNISNYFNFNCLLEHEIMHEKRYFTVEKVKVKVSKMYC